MRSSIELKILKHLKSLKRLIKAANMKKNKKAAANPIWHNYEFDDFDTHNMALDLQSNINESTDDLRLKWWNECCDTIDSSYDNILDNTDTNLKDLKEICEKQNVSNNNLMNYNKNDAYIGIIDTQNGPDILSFNNVDDKNSQGLFISDFLSEALVEHMFDEEPDLTGRNYFDDVCDDFNIDPMDYI